MRARARLAISVLITMIIIILQILLHSELELKLEFLGAASFPVAALRDFFAFIASRWAALFSFAIPSRAGLRLLAARLLSRSPSCG